MNTFVIINIITERGLKATSQKIVILKANIKFNNHPTIEKFNNYLNYF